MSQNDIPGTNGIMTSLDKEKILKIDDIESLVNRVSVEKQEKLVPGINIKTINGESILGEGNLELSDSASGYVVNITYSDLKTLRNNSQLVPGMQYRIIDYHCTTTEETTEAADHQFDIIVTAIDNSTLSHLAKATLHEGDTYFENSNLRAWQLWYDIDNDKTKYIWADEENGKGVIYRMIDEHNNDCPYDFKNMKFLVNNREDDTIPIFCYTFSYILGDVLYDGSTEFAKNCYENKIGEYFISKTQRLNNILFINKLVDVNNIPSCYGNSFKDNCHSNIFRNDCYLNTFEDNCSGNVFGSECYNNTFGYHCRSNTFGNNFICGKINLAARIRSHCVPAKSIPDCLCKFISYCIFAMYDKYLRNI